MTEQNSKGMRFIKSTKIISIIVLLLIILRILLHYTETGFFEFILFDLLPKWWLFLLPTSFFVYRLKSKRQLKISVLDYLLTISGFYVLYFVLTPANFDKLDWNMNYERRQKIVSLAKTNKLKKMNGNIYAIPDSLSLFPFFKSNEITIQTLRNTFVTITFYTDRGLNDHYSGFIYTNDTTAINLFDEKVRNGGNDFKLENNWYQIND